MSLSVDLSTQVKTSVTAQWVESVLGGVLARLQQVNYRVEYDGRRQEVPAAIVAAIETDVVVGVVFVDPAEMQRLNREYRGEDKVTDVLSWGYVEKSKVKSQKSKVYEDNFGQILEEWPEESGEKTVLGEIAVCMEVLKRRAKEFGVSTEDELARMLEHSFFHLVGLHHE